MYVLLNSNHILLKSHSLFHLNKIISFAFKKSSIFLISTKNKPKKELFQKENKKENQQKKTLKIATNKICFPFIAI